MPVGPLGAPREEAKDDEIRNVLLARIDIRNQARAIDLQRQGVGFGWEQLKNMFWDALNRIKGFVTSIGGNASSFASFSRIFDGLANYVNGDGWAVGIIKNPAARNGLSRIFKAISDCIAAVGISWNTTTGVNCVVSILVDVLRHSWTIFVEVLPLIALFI